LCSKIFYVCSQELNRPPPDVTPEINRADEELKINLNLPSKLEIKQAIKKLKTAKASGGGVI
jgi:hypothetical protein